MERTGRGEAARLAIGEGWPVMGTTIVVGTTFGVVARQAGLEPIEIAAMSLLVFAGAAEFVMVRLFAEGAAAPLVIATVLFLNLRHLLMATSLRQHFMRLTLTQRLAAAFFLTDESFAMTTSHFRRGGRTLTYYVTFAVALFILWNLATLAGIALGNTIGEPRRFGIDFAITATFIGIVVLAVRRPADVAVAVVAAAIAGALALAGASTIAVITAGALAPAIAVFARK
ncbi:MAG TPA: AzlC family ABC transporter permease [Candidatus Limnocylindria bacterium]|nr:AzlC family ABC transporter permease [Candidatus Limnocylindria bacterium]